MDKASLRILLSDTKAALPGNGTNDANGNPAVIPLDKTLNASLTVGTAPPASYPALTGAATTAAGKGRSYYRPGQPFHAACDPEFFAYPVAVGWNGCRPL